MMSFKLFLAYGILYGLLLTGSENAVTTTASKGKVQWNENRKLKWSDYLGKSDKNSPYNAESSLQISYGLKISEEAGKTKFSFHVDCFLEKGSSWVKPKSKTEALLKHEQTHFDIAEIYARKLRKKLSESSFNMSNYKNRSSEIFTKNFQEYEKFQAAYDKETNHSLIKDKQKEWNEKVSDLLNTTKKYKKGSDNK